MQRRTVSSLLSFALFGMTMWFSGHVYESIVLGHNILSDPMENFLLWNNLYSRADELFYYLPVMLPVAGIPLILFSGIRDRRLKKNLLQAGIFVASALLLTLYMMHYVNFDLIHGDITGKDQWFRAVAFRWNLLNGVRILLIGAALLFTFKARNRSCHPLSGQEQ